MKRTMLRARCQKSTETLADKSPHRISFFVIACALALTLPNAMYGQANSSFSGNVTDKSGGGVPGATVTVTAQNTGLARERKTDGAGHYLSRCCPPVHTSCMSTPTAFKAAKSKDLTLAG